MSTVVVNRVMHQRGSTGLDMPGQPQTETLDLLYTTWTNAQTSPLLTTALCHYEAKSQLATHTQPQVQQPSAY